MKIEIVMAGHGGQGIMLMGQILSQAGMFEKKHVTWMPSYGPEMRGGTANCTVILSDEPIGSPVVSRPNVVVAMNLPSLSKFEPMIKTGGILIYNGVFVNNESKREDIRKYGIAANEIAAKMGNVKVANMVALGALIGATKAVSIRNAAKALKKTLPPHRRDLLRLNLQALALIFRDGSFEGTVLSMGTHL